MKKLELHLPDDLYAQLVRAAQDQDLAVEDFAEETLSQVLELDEADEDFYDPENEDDPDWDDEDGDAPYDEDD